MFPDDIDRAFVNCIMNFMKKIVISIALLTGITFACEGQMINCAQAAVFMGRDVTICAQVKGAMRDTLGKRSGMLLFLCVPYPHQPVTVIIKDQTLPLFPYTAEAWVGKQICVSGTIGVSKGRPYIEVRKRMQIVM